MLLEIFKTIAVSVSDDSWSYSDSNSGNEDNESTEISFGHPSQHRSYAMFKEGKFTDFTLKFERHDYPVHKCILFSDSQYFHNYLNKKRSFIDITLDWECPQEAIEVFLLSLYTNSVERKTFVKYWWLLCYLAVKYTVKKLKKLCLQEIPSFLNQKRLDAKKRFSSFGHLRILISMQCLQNSLSRILTTSQRAIPVPFRRKKYHFTGIQEIGGKKEIIIID
jgi:hypothetical protein